MSSQDFHEGIETLFDMNTSEWRTLSILGYSVLGALLLPRSKIRAESSRMPRVFIPGGLHKLGIAQKVDAHHRQRVVMMHPTHSLRHLFVFLFLLSDGQMGLSAEGGE